MARTLIDVRCGCGVQRDIWTELPYVVLRCTTCGMRRLRADAPAITPNGIPADREIDIPRIEKVDTKAIATATAKEIEEKFARFSDPVIAEEHVKAEVDAHLNDPLPELPKLEFTRGQDMPDTVASVA